MATESNIANFATRVGSLPDALKPSIADALALGAGFEESGIQAEIAGRAYSILLNQAATNTEKFGEVMGITADEVARLINDDPLEFMIKFAEGLDGMNATDTAETLIIWAYRQTVPIKCWVPCPVIQIGSGVC